MYVFSALDDESMHGAIPSMGRITGSASIETLVRVGIEKENGLGPESKMVVLHDFTPCVDDELEVKRGQIVHVLYQVRFFTYFPTSFKDSTDKVNLLKSFLKLTRNNCVLKLKSIL
jgi:hypothetical protein